MSLPLNCLRSNYFKFKLQFPVQFIYVIIFLLIFSFSHSQISNLNNQTPNGYFDTVFDQYGNRYNINDIRYQQSRTLSSGMISTTLTTADAGYFKLFFETGSGMEGTSTNDIARKAVVIQVFKDVSNYINSPLTTNGLNNKVNIWVRDINAILNATTTNPNPSATSNVLGLATAFYTMPNVNNQSFGGIVDNEIWKTIHTGVDSYTNVASPLSPTVIASGASGLIYHGMMSLNFNNPSVSWNTNMSATSISNYNLYTVLLHEVLHALGFASLISENGTSKFGTGFNYFSRYDKFLKSNSNINLLTQGTNLPSMYNYQFNATLNSTILHPNTPASTSNCTSSTVCSDAIKYVGISTVPVNTPNCFSNGSSLSHFEDECISAPNANLNNAYFLMTDVTPSGIIKKSFKIDERNVLCDLGYNVNANYNYAYGTAFQTSIPLGNAYSGISVAGINDGINPTNGNYTFFGYADTSTQINNFALNMSVILSNDTNATAFEGLEDVFVPTSNSFLSATSGSSSTVINFHSSVGGLHLLRYVPINSLGQRGNITYIYVLLFNFGSGCTVDTTCNLVNNGDFEQFTSLPDNISQIDRACGWQSANSGTPDYFVQGATTTNPFYPSISVPCNFSGYEYDLYYSASPAKKAYVGMGIHEISGYLATEPIYTVLKSTLAVNTSYQLSFDVSLSDFNSSYAVKMQAYLSDSPPATSSPDVAITNPSLLFTDQNYSTISDGWNHVVLNIPPQTNNSLKFLTIGGLNGVTWLNQPHGTQNPPSCPITSYNPYPNRSYYIIDNVKLVPLYGASFNLPNTICSNFVVNDLKSYLTSCPLSGYFYGYGVTYSASTGLYSFQYPTGYASTTVYYVYQYNGCSITLQQTVTLAAPITPTFPTIPILCQGSTPPTLPTTSNNGITGTWSPATISTTASGNYTFTPAAGQCGNAISVAVQVLSNTAFVTNADDLPVTFWQTTTPITTNSVLLNDTYNGGAVPASIPGIPYSIVLTGTPPTIPAGSITFNATTGAFTVTSNTTPGTYVYQYYLQNNCYVTPTKNIKIVVNKFTGENKVGFGFCFNNTSPMSSTSSVTRATTLFNGIKLNGVQTNGTNSTIVPVSPTTTPPPQMTQLTTNGTFTVPASTPPGTYLFYYQICSSGFCTGTILCQIDIDRTFIANADTVTAAASGAITYNVLSNDVYKGTCSSTSIVPASPSNVTITNVVNDPPFYSINTTNGQINVGVSTTPGTHLLSYTICDNLFPSICATTNVLITVPASRNSENGNDDLDLNSIVVYPNPSSGIFSIQFNENLPALTLEIFNMLGQKVYEEKLIDKNVQIINVNYLAQGTYLLKISSYEKVFVDRIIIK